MLAIEEALFTRLNSDPDLTALVNGRIYPNIREENSAYPAVSYRRISSIRESAMGTDNGVVRARFQIDVWADNYDDALAVRKLVNGIIERYSAAEIYDIFIDKEIDLYEDALRIHHLVTDIIIDYNELTE